jgi:chromosome partitioning protein
MAAKIIAVVNQKGGSGKTTISMQLAGTLGRKGLRVLVVDADAQGTATRWSSTAPEDKPFPAAVVNLAHAGNKLHREVQKHLDQYDFIIIDCPPAVESVIPNATLLIANLAIVPIVPSLADLWAAVGIKQVIESVAHINPDLQSRLVVNLLKPYTNLSKDLMDPIRQFGIEMMQATIGDRTAYKESVAGVTVHDLGSKAEAAAQETLRLTDEVLAIFGQQAISATTTI